MLCMLLWALRPIGNVLQKKRSTALSSSTQKKALMNQLGVMIENQTAPKILTSKVPVRIRYCFSKHLPTYA